MGGGSRGREGGDGVIGESGGEGERNHWSRALSVAEDHKDIARRGAW